MNVFLNNIIYSLYHPDGGMHPDRSNKSTLTLLKRPNVNDANSANKLLWMFFTRSSVSLRTTYAAEFEAIRSTGRG